MYKLHLLETTTGIRVGIHWEAHMPKYHIMNMLANSLVKKPLAPSTPETTCEWDPVVVLVLITDPYVNSLKQPMQHMLKVFYVEEIVKNALESPRNCGVREKFAESLLNYVKVRIF